MHPAHTQSDPLPVDLVYALPSIVEPLDLADLFPIAQPLEVELGSGDGSLLLSYAQEHSERNFIGVERLLGRIRKLDRKGRRLGLQNLRGVRIECTYFLKCLLPSQSAEALHIYFPDPWPKSRHRRRRFLRRLELDDLAARLKPQGRIYFVTDFFDYSIQAKVLMLLNDRLSVVDEAPPDEALISVFGRKSVEWGKNTYFVTGSRRD